MWTIDLNFPVPADYKHEFWFVGRDGTRYRIFINGTRTLCCELEGNPDPKTSSRLLDWIQEVVEGIRYELEP